MAYDEGLATRVRQLIGGEKGFSEKKMFGALTFSVDGNMACGVSGDELLVRLPGEETEEALGDPATRPFQMGRQTSTKGWVLVSPAGHAGERDLERWVGRGLAYARTLPAK
jgi:TfoX/Sxy family transcriptional regulator of competence genes